MNLSKGEDPQQYIMVDANEQGMSVHEHVWLLLRLLSHSLINARVV